MIVIKILSCGKNKDEWLDEALKEYSKRLSKICKLEWKFVKEDADLVEEAEKSAFIALDPVGQEFTTETFTKFLFKEIEKGGSRLTFIIGGPFGLPSQIKKGPLISLSRLTFTHQITRLVLAEQIFRAFEIERGSAYHK